MRTFNYFKKSQKPVDSANNWRWALLGAFFGVFLALIVFFPARWLAGSVATFTQEKVELRHVRGTLWNGSAQLALRAGKGSQGDMVLPGRLHWRLRTAWLGVNLQLQSDCCSKEPLAARLRFGWNSVRLNITDHFSQWPTSLLQGLGAPWNTMKLDGELGLRFSQFAWQRINERSTMQGRIEASLRNAVSSLATVRPLGSYRVVVHGSSTPEFRLQTDTGPLFLEGSGHMQGNRMRFSGAAWAAPEQAAALANLLGLLGRRDGQRTILKM